MLMPNSPYWNSVVQQLLTRVAPPVVAATVLLTAAPGNSPAQSGWKWKKPHSQAASAPALPPKNGFASSITRLMDQARSAAQQGDFESALQAATRAEKLADAASGVLGPHADCSPEAASKLVQDLQVLQAATQTTQPSAVDPAVVVSPARPVPVRPNPSPAAVVTQPQSPVPAQGRYPQPPVIARQDVAIPSVAATTLAKPAVKAYVPAPLTPPPVATVATRPVMAASAAPVAAAPVTIRPRYDTVVTADLSVQSAPVSAPTSPQNFLALGEFAIVDDGAAATADDAASAAPALPEDATALTLRATAPQFPEDPPASVAVAASPYVNTFLTESVTLVDEPVSKSVPQPSSEVKLVADEPMGFTFLMETEAQSAEAAPVAHEPREPATRLSMEFTSDEAPEVPTVARQVLATGRTQNELSASTDAESEVSFVLPRPLETDVIPVVTSPQHQGHSPEVPAKPALVAARAQTPAAADDEQNVVIDASLMEWSSATGRKQPISRTRHLELDTAWEPARSDAQPVRAESEPEFTAPVSDQPSAQNTRRGSSVITAMEQSQGGSKYVEAASLVTTHPATLPQVITSLSPSAADPVGKGTASLDPLDGEISTGPATWLRTAEIEPTEESMASTTRPAMGPTRWIEQLATTCHVSPRIIGLMFGGCGLLVLGSGLLLFRGSRSHHKV